MFGLTGCGDIADISKLKGYTEEELQDALMGKDRDDIVDAWGEPDGMLSGFWGDIWSLSDDNRQIILYYNGDGNVEHVKVIEEAW